MFEETMLFVLLLSVLMLLFLNWVYFFDWLQVVGWIVFRISPKKVVKEIENERTLRQCITFKRHLRKWKVRFLIVPISFSVVFLTFSALTDKLLASYFGGMVFVLIAYGIISKHETAERKSIINTIEKMGDGSLS